jgi:hypothetical protein
MTYNFDPDGWYDRQRAVLEAQRQRGELDEAALTLALLALEQRYEEMLTRQDRPFELPRSRS